MSNRPTWGAALSAFLALSVTACMQVPERPLDPEALLASVRRERESAPPTDALTLTEAVARMRRANPAIREARAAWHAAEALAKVPTPPPNPTLSLGPLLVGGTDILSSAAPGIEAALGWAVPLNNARALRDQLHRLRAREALAEAAAVERETYLALRADLAAALLERDRAATRRSLAAAARDAVEVARRLAEAGGTSAVDVRLLDLDAERAHADAVAAEGEAEARRHGLAARLGSAPSGVVLGGLEGLAPLPAELPSAQALEAAAVAQHPRLAVLRAAYLVAEKELRLQVAEAMPDLKMGVGFENEAGDVKLGLPFSIELPLWDRNQQGIVEACARRDRERVRYLATLHRLLAGVATARARLAAQRDAHEALAGRVGPAAERVLEAARQSLGAGSLDALRYLEALRAQREVQVDVLAARASLYEAWTSLEAAAGMPLLRFPDEPAPETEGN